MSRRTLLYILVGMAMMLTSCQERVVYSHYESTPIKGWERNDTLSFDIPSIQKGGYFEEVLGLRINGEYPFMGLSLVVKQTVLPSGHLGIPISRRFGTRQRQRHQPLPIPDATHNTQT